jgi:hypothetical protein
VILAMFHNLQEHEAVLGEVKLIITREVADVIIHAIGGDINTEFSRPTLSTY